MFAKFGGLAGVLWSKVVRFVYVLMADTAAHLLRSVPDRERLVEEDHNSLQQDCLNPPPCTAVGDGLMARMDSYIRLFWTN